MNPKIALLKALAEFQFNISSRQMPSIPKRDVCLVASLMKRRQVAKGELILNVGEVLQDIIIIEKGIVRQFYYKNGLDITEQFSSEGQYVVCIESLLLKKPTNLMIEALEPTTFYTIRFSDLEKLLDKSISLLNLYRYFAENNLIFTQYKADAMRFESSATRYAKFIKQFPEAAKRASVKHIASYLLMTPESLSRVRSKLSQKDKK